MLKLLKALFSTPQEDKGQNLRRLRHPNDLREGDIIKFGYLPISSVSKQEFEIIQVNTYVYGDICYPEHVLQDRSGNLFYLMIEDDDGDEYLAISKKIPKSEISEFLSEEKLSRIIEGKTMVIFQKMPESLYSLAKNSYSTVDFAIKGAFIKGDARYLTEEEANKRDKFVSYILEDRSGEFAIEVEVYESGETEVCVTVYQDLDVIEEMWPSNRIFTSSEKGSP